MKRKDMTYVAFIEALESRGIRLGLFGYYYVTENRLVFGRNGGNSRREQLAYLIGLQTELQTKTTGNL